MALVKMAKAAAWLSGRNYVIPRDVREQFPYVARHRISAKMPDGAEQKKKEEIINELLQQIKEPPMGT